MGWQNFSNTLSNNSDMGAGFNNFPGWFAGGSPQAGSPSFGIEQSYNALNSPNSAMSSGIALGGNPYQAATPDWFSMGGAFGNGQTGGWAMPALQGLSSMMQWSQGNKALDLAEDQFNLSKEMAQKNLANQTSLLNTAMRDRQNARRSASSSVQDTDSYMANNGI